MRVALIVMDMQMDFLPGGSLAVPGGDSIIPALNECIQLFAGRDELVVFSRDWHPQGHSSFVTHGGTWPVHCVQGTAGAEIDPRLMFPSTCVLVSKATSVDKEAYSAFEDTDLSRLFKALGIGSCFVGGVATDYCVKSTVLDAARNRFDVFLLTDAIKGVDINPGDSARAVTEMREVGAILLSSGDLKKRFAVST